MYDPMPTTDIALLLRHGMLYKKLVASVTKMLDHYKDRLPHKLVLPIAMSVPVLFAISQYGKYILNQSNENYTQKIIHVLVALIIIAVGNYLPKTKPSRFVGLKFFWLLDKPVLWFKVHRLAGYLWILSGVLMLSLGVSNKCFWIVSYVMLLYV